MSIPKNLLRPFYRFIKSKYLSLLTTKLHKINEKSAFTLKDSKNKIDGVVVSLTTHGLRIKTVYITIESILNGDSVPEEIILWLDDAMLFNDLPITLLRLQNRGLDIRLTKNYGPHTKYYPYILLDKSTKYLVTADDDIIYPKYWLHDLYKKANLAGDKIIVCYRAHEISFDDNEFSQYNSWKPCKSTEPNIKHFATGVSGVIYPIDFQKVLFRAGDDFISKCPKADDIWLHYIAYKNGYKIQQISKKSIHFPMVAGTEIYGLWNSNVSGSNNDVQIKNTYSGNDMKSIKESCENSAL